MSEQGNKSEVARIRQQITDEYESAKRGLGAYAAVASHEVIKLKMERIRACHEELEKLVGPAEAIKIIYEIAETVM